MYLFWKLSNSIFCAKRLVECYLGFIYYSMEQADEVVELPWFFYYCNVVRTDRANFMFGPLRVHEVKFVGCRLAQFVLSFRHLNFDCHLFAAQAKIPRELVGDELWIEPGSSSTMISFF